MDKDVIIRNLLTLLNHRKADTQAWVRGGVRKGEPGVQIKELKKNRNSPLEERA